ncbi:hypothetical protein KI387_000499, partial [Taxus chinensis]
AYWRSLLSLRTYKNDPTFFKSTQFVRRQHYHAASEHKGFYERAQALRLIKPVFSSIYTLFGLILLDLFMGFENIKLFLVHSPGVYVDKKKRKTIPEVVDPDFVLKKSEEFHNKSWFRRLAHNVKLYSDLAKSMPWILESDT